MEGVGGSFRSRFITTALVFGTVAAAIGLYSAYAIKQTAARGVAIVDEGRHLKRTLDELVWALQRTESGLYLYAFDPGDAAGNRTQERLAHVRDALDRMGQRVDAASFPRLAADVGKLKADYDALRDGAAQLVRVANDVEQRFPAIPVVRTHLYPNSQAFLQAVESALFLELPDSRVRDLLLELRRLWDRQLMQSRLFFANRFGVYGAPEESMERNLSDRQIYIGRIQANLQALVALDLPETPLPFEVAVALEAMHAAAENYESAFAEAAAIYRSPGWRQDLPLMHRVVKPVLDRMWHRIQDMGERLDGLLQQGLVDAVDRARSVGYLLWLVIGGLSLLLLLAYLVFERAIREPLLRVARALEAEGRGEPRRQLPPEGTEEIRLLQAAFEGMRRQVRSRQLRLESILTHAHDGIFSFDTKGCIESANTAAEVLFGSGKEGLTGRSIVELIPDFELRALPEGVSTAQQPERTFTARRYDGTSFQMSLKLSLLELEGEHLFVAIVADVTEREAMIARLNHLATYDALTGLYNRRFFMEELGRALDRAPRGVADFALLYIDLDNFKYVNDTLGHLIGDRVLVEVTEILREHLRRGDILARLGGDEFAVLLYEAGGDQAMAAAERFRAALAAYRLFQDGQAVDVGCSIGVAILFADVGSREEWLARADYACHLAKQQGRNRCHLYRGENRRSQMSMSLEMGWAQRLKTALAADGFSMVRQPIIRLATGEREGYEVLLRLPQTDGTPIMPAGFLPAAGRFGLLTKIDSWVVGTVIAALARQEGEEVYAINLSERALTDPEVLRRIIRELDCSRVDAQRLRFEIGEASLGTGWHAACRFAAELRRLGCTVVLDNFGAGHASLLHLKGLPVDIIKFDGAFLSGLGEDPERQAIVAAINDVAHATGKRTLAQHIEDEADYVAAKALDIDLGQGFHFGEPERFAFSPGWGDPAIGQIRAESGK